MKVWSAIFLPSVAVLLQCKLMEGRYFIHWTSQNRIPNAVSWSRLLVCSFASTLACLYLWQFVAFGETGRQAQSNLKVNWLSVAQDCRKRYCSCLRVFFVSFYSIDNLCVPQMPTYVVSEKKIPQTLNYAKFPPNTAWKVPLRGSKWEPWVFWCVFLSRTVHTTLQHPADAHRLPHA